MTSRNCIRWLMSCSAYLLLAAMPPASAVALVEAGQEAAPFARGDARVPAGAPKISITGVVDRVSIDEGPGVCSLTVRENEQTHTVILGSVRYLLDQDFSPKAGDTIKVQGFHLEDSRVAARRVELPGQKKKVDFRDNEGRPLWSGGARNRTVIGVPGMGPGRGPGGQRGPGAGRGGRRP